MSKTPELPRLAELHTDGWAGRRVQIVNVIGETPKRFRIIAGDPIRLPRRELRIGEEALVPKRSIRFLLSGGTER